MYCPDQPACVIGGICVLAFFFAKVEIHIEGEDGWAAKLPTWRLENHWALTWFFGGRPLTGYHAWMLSFMLLVFHLGPLMTGMWNWLIEARIIGSFIIFWIVEDWLWFLINPRWGWRRFNRSHVTWHKRWFLGLPADYWLFAPIAAWLLWRSWQT